MADGIRLELGVFIAMGTVAAVLDLKSAVPGREAERKELALLTIMALAAITLISCEPSSDTASLSQFIHVGIKCAFFTVMFAALPWIGFSRQGAEERRWHCKRRPR